MENLDLACARCGRKMASRENENLLTHALGVLEAQGVYAFFLFLEQQKKNRGPHPVTAACMDFLRSHPDGRPLVDQEEDTLEAVSQLAQDLDDLLLAHQLLCRTLVYARHHAKVGESESTS